MLERHELEAFLTLAEELHFGRTAERMHVSTARVSQTIRKLERRVGVPLFHRTSRRVELSAVGRQLYDDVAPAWAQIGLAIGRAIDAGRGITDTLRIAFTGAAAGQLLVGATELFRDGQPGCGVQIREAQLLEVLPWLREGTVDIALATFPVDEPDITMGPVLVTEARMLAVPSGHRFAGHDAVSIEDLARVPVLQVPDPMLDAGGGVPAARTTPAGLPIPPGPPATTVNEMLTLIGAGAGVFPMGASARRYYARPDVTYVVLRGAPPLEWGLLWRSDRASARVRAFSRAAHDLVLGHGSATTATTRARYRP